MNDIDFKSGIVTYNEFNLNFEKSLSEQLECLNEDLLQVEYLKDYLLDLGWYPEYDVEGNFIIQVIKDKEWSHPIYKGICRNKDILKMNIEHAVNIITYLINSYED